EDSPVLGNLARDFDFSQPPAPPFILPTHPASWSLPAAFRLLLHAPARQKPRFHGGDILLGATCVTRCRILVTRYLSLRRPPARPRAGRPRRGAPDPNAPPEHRGRTLLPRKAQRHGAPSVAASAPGLHCGPGKLDGDRDAGGPAERNRERERQRAAGRVSAAMV